MSQESAVAKPPATGGPDAAAPQDSGAGWPSCVIMLAQLMVVLDATVVNIALPHAQSALHISDADRQWIVTAYTLTFGGLLLLGGRIADYFGRKRTFMIGLIGFAARVRARRRRGQRGMLFGARALQGAFGALLAPAALSLLTVTFTEPKERAKAFGVFGAISGGGAAIGLISGGVLTEYAYWRWCLLVNIPIAVIAFVAGSADRAGEPGAGQHPVRHPGRDARHRRPGRAGLRLHQGGQPRRTTGPLAGHARRGLPRPWCCWRLRVVGVPVKNPLLPLRVILDRNRGDVVHRVDPGRCRPARHVPVHDVLPAADAALQRAEDRHRVPAVLRRHHRRGRHRRAAAAARSARGS